MDEVNMENNTVSPLLIKKLSLATSILFTLSMQHYCHPKTNKKYLQADMNTEEMYNLYNKECEKENIKTQKSFYYRYIFSNNFNINFPKPKTDRCDRFEEIKLKIKQK